MALASLTASIHEYKYSTPGQPPLFNTLNPGNPFALMLAADKVQILSTNTRASGTDISGFLYVPTYPAGSDCANATARYIPQNATTINDIPAPTDAYQIAFGPWTNSKCVMEYLQNAGDNQAKAFLTYLPDRYSPDNYSTAVAPIAADPAWDLNDGGNWKNTFGFPVYALNSNDATLVMTQLSLFSGDVASAPNNATLVKMFGADAKARVYVDTAIFNTSQLPSLWVFLLIVVGVLVGVLFFASIIMRFVHRRRRLTLARMIANGEVSLETLGVTRLKVTRQLLEKMPLYIYVTHGESPGAPHAPAAENATGQAADAPALAGASSDNKKPSLYASIFERSKKPTPTAQAVTSRVLEEKAVSFPLETCVICLDDFENHVTTVRWLPCGHVFHPACIDPLLLEYSSLCPTCKASVLPKDHVPEVTNLMVRRERLMRRVRDLSARQGLPVDEAAIRGGQRPNVPSHFRGVSRFSSRNTSQRNSNQTTVLELQGLPNSESSGNDRQGTETTTEPGQAGQTAEITAAEEAARRPENVTREEWARQRAADLVGTTETVAQAEQREERRLPAWRRVLGPVFPNLRT